MIFLIYLSQNNAKIRKLLDYATLRRKHDEIGLLHMKVTW